MTEIKNFSDLLDQFQENDAPEQHPIPMYVRVCTVCKVLLDKQDEIRKNPPVIGDRFDLGYFAGLQSALDCLALVLGVSQENEECN